MKKSIRIIIHAAAALAFIGAGFAGYMLLKSSREALGRHEINPPLPLVRTVPVEIKTVEMAVTGVGTVRPLKETRVVPQVSGRVIKVSENLVNGGAFKKGDILLAIEPRDYEIAVTLAEASLRDAESSYETALQESRASRREWKRLHPDQKPPPLVAKEPQLAAARANLEAQKANLAKARLDLERTRIQAPFDGRVSSDKVDIGQYVTPGQELATIYSTEAVEIVVPMESGDLEWFEVPGFTTDSSPGSKALVQAEAAGRSMKWHGRVVRAEGKINEETRMVNVVIRVKDAYSTRPPLSIGQFAEVKISGRNLSGAAVIPRAAVHEDNLVWAVNPENGRLYFRTVEVAGMDDRGVVITSGLKESDQAVISPLKGAADGMRVRHVSADGETG